MYDIKQSEYGGDEVEFSTQVYVKAVVCMLKHYVENDVHVDVCIVNHTY